jgi:hypothetical protein
VEFVTYTAFSPCGDICFSSSWKDGGVRVKNIKLDPDKWDLIRVPPDSLYAHFAAEKKWYLRKTELDKPYDFWGAITCTLPLKLQAKKKWFCSELVATILGFKDPWSYSPQDLFLRCRREGWEFHPRSESSNSHSLKGDARPILTVNHLKGNNP